MKPVSLGLLAEALPLERRIPIALRRPLSWIDLASAAEERAAEIGGSNVLWREAQSVLGLAGAAGLVLLADADSVERGGGSRLPAAWVRAMTARARSQPLQLHRNLGQPAEAPPPRRPGVPPSLRFRSITHSDAFMRPLLIAVSSCPVGSASAVRDLRRGLLADDRSRRRCAAEAAYRRLPRG